MEQKELSVLIDVIKNAPHDQREVILAAVMKVWGVRYFSERANLKGSSSRLLHQKGEIYLAAGNEFMSDVYFSLAKRASLGIGPDRVRVR